MQNEGGMLQTICSNKQCCWSEPIREQRGESASAPYWIHIHIHTNTVPSPSSAESREERGESIPSSAESRDQRAVQAVLRPACSTVPSPSSAESRE